MTHPFFRAFLLSSLFLTKAFAADPDCVANKTCVQVTINNQSGYPLFVEIQGQRNSFFDFASGDYDYSKPFSQTNNLKQIDFPGSYTFNLPGSGIDGGGRMYFSSKDKMNGIPDLATADINFDKIELGWNASGTAIWNTTSVDYFAIPVNISQQNGNTIKTVGFKDGTTRQTVLDELKAKVDSKFLMYSNITGELLRVFSPLHFYTTLSDDWKDSIAKGLNTLNTGGFTEFKYGDVTFSDFKLLKTTSPYSISIKENGNDVVISNINTGNAAGGQIAPVGDRFAAILSAAINRGVLDTPARWGQSGGTNEGYPQYYYQNPPYNTYAAVLFKYAIDSKLYATSYDDVFHMDSSLNVGRDNNNPLTIKILPFN